MKKVLITGASRGIGRACAIAFCQAGYDVFANYNHSEVSARELSNINGCHILKADVSDASQVSDMFRQIGNIDVLVCNAGISLFKMFCDMTRQDWDNLFNTNFFGMVNCIQAALPGMVHQKHGSILTVSSIWGQTGASCESAYSASKAAVIGLSKALAKELGPSGITVNCLAPGVIDTEMNAALSVETIDTLKEETPLGTIGTPESIARAAVYLAEAEYVTGQVLGINGGLYI